MKILLVVNSFPTLSETFIVNKAIGLKKYGYDVSVLVHSKHNDYENYKYLNELDEIKIIYSPLIGYLKKIITNPTIIIKAIYFSIFRKFSFTRYIKNTLMMSHLKNYNFDLIHFEFSGIAIQYLDIIKSLNSVIFVSCRGAAELITPLINKDRKNELRNLFNYVNRVHCVTEHIADRMKIYGLKNENFFINYPSVKIEKYSINKDRNNNGPINIVSVSRLHWKKGLIFGLIAINNLLQKGYKIKYSIIGGGVERDSLEFFINEKGIGNYVELIGPKSNSFVKKLLKKADIFLLPSLSEGLSNSALEAMAMKVPVVSTRSGGMGEAIQNNHNGYLVEICEVDEMTDKIEKLLSSKNLRDKIGNNAHKTIQNKFQIHKQIEIFHKEYSKNVS